MDIETYEDILAYVYKNNIYCHCIFEWKDNLKSLGFKWDNNVKLWYIPANLLTEDIYKKTLEVRFNGKDGKKDYYWVHYYTPFSVRTRIKELSKQTPYKSEPPKQMQTYQQKNWREMNAEKILSSIV